MSLVFSTMAYLQAILFLEDTGSTAFLCRQFATRFHVGIHTYLFDQGEQEMKYGAKNQLVGTVAWIKRGTVMSQVDFTIMTKSPMSSVLTIDSLDNLGIKEGDKVKVVVKAVNVLLINE